MERIDRFCGVFGFGGGGLRDLTGGRIECESLMDHLTTSADASIIAKKDIFWFDNLQPFEIMRTDLLEKSGNTCWRRSS
jgi:hypothetical protein